MYAEVAERKQTTKNKKKKAKNFLRKRKIHLENVMQRVFSM